MMGPAGQQQTTTRLPRSTLLQRRRPLSGWTLATVIALVVNLALVVALSQVSRLAPPPAPPAPLALRSVRQVESPPPPSAPARAQPRAQDQSVAEAVPLALPALDLPPAGVGSDLALPACDLLGDALDLPLSVPAFTPVGPAAEDGPPLAVGPLGPPAFDTPAEREGAFDLDRFYPRSARLRGVTGSTSAEILIDATGRVAEVTVLASEPPGVFEHAAERLLQSLRYRPATKAGEPVPSRQRLTLEWTLAP